MNSTKSHDSVNSGEDFSVALWGDSAKEQNHECRFPFPT